MSYNKTIGAFFFGLHQYYLTLESDVHIGFASVNITVLGLTNTDANLKRMHQLYIVCIRIHVKHNPYYEMLIYIPMLKIINNK